VISTTFPLAWLGAHSIFSTIVYVSFTMVHYWLDKAISFGKPLNITHKRHRDKNLFSAFHLFFITLAFVILHWKFPPCKAPESCQGFLFLHHLHHHYLETIVFNSQTLKIKISCWKWRKDENPRKYDSGSQPRAIEGPSHYMSYHIYSEGSSWVKKQNLVV
jgi:hypothetical protein